MLAEGLTWAGTFHAIGARLLRDYAGAIGLDPEFTIHDREDSADLMNLARHRLGFSGDRAALPGQGHLPRDLLAGGQRPGAARRGARADTSPGAPSGRPELKQLFAAYVAAKQESAVLDYDDLLLYWAGMMQEPALAAEIGGRFDHVLVDEYQDTNRLQAAILAGLKPDGRGLTVVGDDAQSIYAFRAAEVRNILDFPALFTPPARVVTLEQNYRSTPADPRRGQRGDRRGARGLRQAAPQRPPGRARLRRSSPCATRPARSTTSAARSSTPARPAPR